MLYGQHHTACFRTHPLFVGHSSWVNERLFAWRPEEAKKKKILTCVCVDDHRMTYATRVDILPGNLLVLRGQGKRRSKDFRGLQQHTNKQTNKVTFKQVDILSGVLLRDQGGRRTNKQKNKQNNKSKSYADQHTEDNSHGILRDPLPSKGPWWPAPTPGRPNPTPSIPNLRPSLLLHYGGTRI